VLRTVFGPKRDEIIGDRRKLYNKELHRLYFLPYIIRIVKWRRVKLARHVARMGVESIESIGRKP
jgi:hypothetical protein